MLIVANPAGQTGRGDEHPSDLQSGAYESNVQPVLPDLTRFALQEAENLTVVTALIDDVVKGDIKTQPVQVDTGIEGQRADGISQVDLLKLRRYRLLDPNFLNATPENVRLTLKHSLDNAGFGFGTPNYMLLLAPELEAMQMLKEVYSEGSLNLVQANVGARINAYLLRCFQQIRFDSLDQGQRSYVINLSCDLFDGALRAYKSFTNCTTEQAMLDVAEAMITMNEAFGFQQVLVDRKKIADHLSQSITVERAQILSRSTMSKPIPDAPVYEDQRTEERF